MQAVDDGSGNLVDRRNLRTAAWGGLIGTALEQYDFVIYGTATAIIFNKIFFTQADPAMGVLAGFATYAVGFLARPLGGRPRCGKVSRLYGNRRVVAGATKL